MADELHSSTRDLAELLREWKGEDVAILELGAHLAWARFCIIGCCNSLTHMRGVLNQLRLVTREERFANLELLAIPRQIEDFSWCVVDLGQIVVHLMSREAREFYNLEQLWQLKDC